MPRHPTQPTYLMVALPSQKAYLHGTSVLLWLFWPASSPRSMSTLEWSHEFDVHDSTLV